MATITSDDISIEETRFLTERSLATEGTQFKNQRSDYDGDSSSDEELYVNADEYILKRLFLD